MVYLIVEEILDKPGRSERPESGDRLAEFPIPHAVLLVGFAGLYSYFELSGGWEQMFFLHIAVGIFVVTATALVFGMIIESINYIIPAIRRKRYPDGLSRLFPYRAIRIAAWICGMLFVLSLSLLA